MKNTNENFNNLLKLAVIFDSFVDINDDVWKVLRARFPQLRKWWQENMPAEEGALDILTSGDIK